MPTKNVRVQCEKSRGFNPDEFFDSWDSQQSIPQKDDFRGCIIRAFKLSNSDSFQYDADMAIVRLVEAQQVIDFKDTGGLHSWYRDEKDNDLGHPPTADCVAYTALFSPSTSLPKALIALKANAKKDSLRAQVAAHLESQFIPPKAPLALPAKAKNPAKNPYLDLWTWSCINLEWAGPVPLTEKTAHAHHILPILYHHFGCLAPTHAALTLISQVAAPDPHIKPRPKSKQIIEIGSGTGYWTYVLRRSFPELNVLAIDNLKSNQRTRWIGDTLVEDGAGYLLSHRGGEGCVLLMVYPSVGENFTGKVLRAFQGDAVIIAGTQNRNGYTTFKDETITAWVARERTDWEEAARIPLPSFAGKDEGLFVFKKKLEAEASKRQ